MQFPSRARRRVLAALAGQVSRAALVPSMLAAVLVLAPGLAAAWSAPGHRIVGLAAEQLLSGDARRELRALVGDESLGDVGVYLDAERDRLNRELPGSTKWHYDNRPVCDASAPRPRYCPDGRCASAQFERWLGVLADRAAPREQRVLALRIVVHVLADVHQPLHAGDNRDRGGNDVNVGWGRRDQVRSLHRLWDRELVDAAMGRESERGFAVRLVSERRREIARIQGGTYEQWMDESYRLARDVAYGGLPPFACGERLPFITRLSDDYRREAERTIRLQLARAGIRLAGVLNRALDP